ncbi:MAG: cyclic nucleotide-binding domain-containing protein [Planctomycetaceae bacterium]
MRKVLFLLSHLSEADLDWLMSAGSKCELVPGSVLIEKGKQIDTLYLVLDGTLEISGVDIGDKPIRLGSGEVVGEISLLDSRPPTATVSAYGDAVVLAIPHERLTHKLEGDAGFASRFYRSLATLLAHRLRRTYRNLGYGVDEPMDEDAEYEDELSPEILDTVHLTGTRFNRALRRKLSE